MWLLLLLAMGQPHTHLTWTQSPTPDVYANGVYRAEQSGGPYTEIYESSVPIVCFDDTTVVVGTKYCYVVTAIDVTGESGYSNEACKAVANPSFVPLPVKSC